jgi:hypothetical protein
MLYDPDEAYQHLDTQLFDPNRQTPHAPAKAVLPTPVHAV